MGVRLATQDDVERIVDMSEALVYAISGPLEVDRARTRENVLLLIANPNAVIFVTDGGFIAGIIQPTIISPRPVAQEVGWYATDKSGVRLLRTFEKWAASKGVNMVKASTGGMDLSRLGYSRAEIAWTKEI